MNPRAPLAGLAILLLAEPAAGGPLPPGAELPLSGDSFDNHPEWAGTVMNDTLHDFTVRNGSGEVILEGRLQDRCVKSNLTGNLVFKPWVRDLSSPSGTGRVVAIVVGGHGGLTIDAEYALAGSGAAPSGVARSAGRGEEVTILFEPDGVGPPDGSRPVELVTDAPGYSLDGEVVVVAEDGPGGERFSTTLQGTVAPVWFDPSAIPVVSFVPDGNRFVLTFLAEAGRFFALHTAPSPEGPWVYRTQVYRKSSPAEITISPWEPVDGREFYRLETVEDP